MLFRSAIGKVKEVHTWSSKKWGDRGAPPSRIDAVPAGFNWDLWLGVSAERAHVGDKYYHPGNWRKRLDFGTGTFGDMGCHIFDPVFTALGLGAPKDVVARGPQHHAETFAGDEDVLYTFPGTDRTTGDLP